MKYDFDYLGTKELFDDCLKTCWEFKSGSYLEDCYLPEFKESSLAEAERLNVLLPLIKWEVDNNDLSEAMSDEFYLYYEDLLKGSVTDNIGTVGEILLRDGRFGQTTGMGVVHSDEMVGLSRGNTGVGKSDFLCANNVRKGMCCLPEQSYIESKHQTK